MTARHWQPSGLAVILAAVTAVSGLDVAAAETGPSAQQIYGATGVAGGLVVHVGCGDAKLTAALDPRSGQVVKRHSVEQVFQGAIHHQRCYQNKATEKYMTYSRNGVDFVETATRRGTATSSTSTNRATCSSAGREANGEPWIRPTTRVPSRTNGW